MNKLSLFDFFDQRRIISHISFMLFSIFVALLMKVFAGDEYSSSDLLVMFVMIYLQIEVFIYFGNILFGRLNFNQSPGEITRIVLFRFMIFIAACLFISMILYIMLKIAISFLSGGGPARVIPDFFRLEIADWFRSTIKGLTFGAVIFVVLLWQTSLRREQKLREENLVFQHETLKSQVNPHFLFNSLNTVSSLIQSQPEKAEEFINNLSSVYRYILENGQKDMVPLQSELDLINRYFDLHRVRDEEKILMSIDYSGAGNYQILPVSLQIPLENAIKHNTATRENPLKISIYFEDQYIVVKNNLQKKASQLKSTGIGLKNLAERLRLITGKDLITEETNEFFIVKIPLLK
jgi:two-component system, LytTR family, sensor kinase